MAKSSRQQKPKLHESFTAEINALSSEGHGVTVHSSGMKCFVSHCYPGDEGIFEIIAVKKRFAFARLKELLKAGPHRVKPPCDFHLSNLEGCTGCSWMSLDYQKQLDYKEELIREQLRYHNIEHTPETIKGTSQNLSYRNRFDMVFSEGVLGYTSSLTKNCISVDKCVVLNKKCSEKLERLKLLESKSELPSDFEKVGVDDQSDGFYWGKRAPFQQGHHEQNIYMKKWLANKIVHEKKTSQILELFSGAGNFTEVLSSLDFENVVCCEGSTDTVVINKDIHSNYVHKHVDLFKTKTLKQIIETDKTEILILDPPRDGFPLLKEFISAMPSLRRIFYISCNMQTAFREISSVLSEGTFSVSEIQPVDQFPQTPHVEQLIELVRV